ncbi:phosphoglycerate mutase-like protein [Punica granatum]|uniref:Phosphoglycerate mutase-like protein n=1 Tax=Punica granatum TaxID=22663 RepID=A0A6P8C9P0_PUNGR|nr:phosphoglycerate mutase-like protein [Punica granatum]
MDSNGVASPYQNCKIVHWVRHAEGIHNVESEKNHDALLSSVLLDAQLSPRGWQQVNDLHKHVRDSGLLKRIDLVVTSPLSRTMQTATGVFGQSDESEKLPFLAVELCRERLGVHPCDKRRSIKEYKSIFPSTDFSQIESNDDILWKPDHRETPEEIAARGVKFMNWLKARPEKEIAVVTHSVFLLHVLNTFGEGNKSEKSNFFKNCELRSMTIVDGSISGSDCPSKPNSEEVPETKLKLISLESA